MPKFITTVTLTAMVALSLVACSSPSDSSCEATPAGPHSNSIKVSGDFGKEPKVTMPPAFDTDKTERTVVISGKGEPAQDGDIVETHYAVYNASTRKAVELEPGSTWSNATFSPNASQKSALPGLYDSLLCARAGDRLVTAVPADQLFGHTKTDMSNQGIGATDTVVFIFDVSKVGPAPTEPPAPAPSSTPVPLPTPVPWVDNVPAVDLNGDVPVVTLPASAPPTELELKVIEEGAGADVSASSTVTVDYQGTSWDKNTIFDQSYTRGEPATFPVSGVIEGFAAAMVGQKVGATVLVTIPPKYAYGDGAINDTNLVGQTLVFLIQIRDVK